MTKETKATTIGFGAIILWSAIVGLIKEVSHSFGATAGAALIYSVASVFLLLTMKWTPLSSFPKKYLIFGGILFISYELCLALSIGYTTNSRQAIEVGMVNYLWPTFTMIATVIFTSKTANWLIFPGAIISMCGLVWVLGGDQGFNFNDMLSNIAANPLSYGLAFIGAILWSTYCVVTVRSAKGFNGITLFFILVSIVLWLKYFIIGGTHELHISASSILFLVLAASSMGFGYAAWNVGILRGNVTILAGASYFVPVISAALSSFILATPLGLSFWQGALMVCTGSIICWISTGSKKKPSD